MAAIEFQERVKVHKVFGDLYLKLAHCHFYHTLLIKGNHQVSPDARAGLTDSFFWEVGLQNSITKGENTGSCGELRPFLQSNFQASRGQCLPVGHFSFMALIPYLLNSQSLAEVSFSFLILFYFESICFLWCCMAYRAYIIIYVPFQIDIHHSWLQSVSIGWSWLLPVSRAAVWGGFQYEGALELIQQKCGLKNLSLPAGHQGPAYGHLLL